MKNKIKIGDKIKLSTENKTLMIVLTHPGKCNAVVIESAEGGLGSLWSWADTSIEIENNQDIPASKLQSIVSRNLDFCRVWDGKDWIPVMDVYKAKSIIVELNSDYDAIVEPNQITVGCQSFNPDVIYKLVEAHKSLFGK